MTDGRNSAPPPADWLTPQKLAEVRRNLDLGVDIAPRTLRAILATTIDELTRLRALITAPELDEFWRGAQLEAAHQVERWGADHDAGKTDDDWLWLVAYLTTKATQAARYGDRDKHRHHLITAAAALANWHRRAAGGDDRMRPGIGPGSPAYDAASALSTDDNGGQR